ncbi:MAG: DinB family protein [Wenzhouxiangellaceae bacterium]|nr:DinB family protein [Wenzhouxiangellaceae bacterium]
MPREIVGFLVRQHDLAWSLASCHLEGLGTDECLWRPSARGLHVTQLDDGKWRGEWPKHEGYDLGPPSIAWLAWHIGYWWSTVIDRSFGNASSDQSDVVCPNTADGIRSWLASLHDKWKECLAGVNDNDLRSSERTRWPFEDRPFGDVVAWVNVELTKNASELGYAKFLYATRTVA